MNLALELQPSEQILWSDIKRSGWILHKRIVQILAVTNYSIILWRENLSQTTINLSDISSIEVMDRKSSGSSHYMGYSFGNRQFRNYRSIGDYSSKQIGTVIFFVGSSPVMTWYGISDPMSLKSLVLNQIKRLRQYR